MTDFADTFEAYADGDHPYPSVFASSDQAVVTDLVAHTGTKSLTFDVLTGGGDAQLVETTFPISVTTYVYVTKDVAGTKVGPNPSLFYIANHSSVVLGFNDSEGAGNYNRFFFESYSVTVLPEDFSFASDVITVDGWYRITMDFEADLTATVSVFDPSDVLLFTATGTVPVSPGEDVAAAYGLAALPTDDEYAIVLTVDEFSWWDDINVVSLDAPPAGLYLYQASTDQLLPFNATIAISTA